MRTPTADQKVVLADKNSRIRVVRAAPGSGKTWLVAELIRKTLNEEQMAGGIAALSFTRVGGDEIRKAVGYDPGHPHFVGTIDSFLFRYVIRPHLRKVFEWFADPRIVAGEWGAEHWSKCGRSSVTTVGPGINVFGCIYIGEEQGVPVLAYKPHRKYSLVRLSGSDLGLVNLAKERIWKKRGLLTHSDAAFWACRVLGHPKFGARIRAEVARRFPFLVVDELQDTGHFLAKSIRLLLEEPSVSGVLVGDPDQAIYEFTGALPNLFKEFESIAGAARLSLANSLRCPPSVANAANHLKESPGEFGPAADRVGRALLVRYQDMAVEVSKVFSVIRACHASGNLKVISRATATAEELVGRRTKYPPKLYCPPLNHILRAVVAFRQGRNVVALAAARSALEKAIFQYEAVAESELTAAENAPQYWKALTVRCLLKANAVPTTSTIMEWQRRAGVALDEEIGNFGLSPAIGFAKGKLKPRNSEGWDSPSVDFFPRPTESGDTVAIPPAQTVHSVKGETHDVTLFVCPTTSVSSCPSEVWWSASANGREEKRIAYVAMTRTRGDLIVCVSEACYGRLATKHPEFLESFECMTVSECISSFAEGPGAQLS
jgi:DNA helicase-2/ATP-dependent DNA helicase PcrA